MPVSAQLAVQTQRVVGRRRILHVDANEVAARRSVLDDRAQIVAAKLVAELQTEPCELDADVRVEPAALDVGEDVEVGPDDRRGLLLGRDLLAEDVDRCELSFGVAAAHGFAGVLQLGPGDVTLGELLHDGPRDDREQADDRTVEDRHGPRFYGRARRTCAPGGSGRRTSTEAKPAVAAWPASSSSS